MRSMKSTERSQIVGVAAVAAAVAELTDLELATKEITSTAQDKTERDRTGQEGLIQSK